MKLKKLKSFGNIPLAFFNFQVWHTFLLTMHIFFFCWLIFFLEKSTFFNIPDAFYYYFLK